MKLLLHVGPIAVGLPLVHLDSERQRILCRLHPAISFFDFLVVLGRFCQYLLLAFPEAEALLWISVGELKRKMLHKHLKHLSALHFIQFFYRLTFWIQMLRTGYAWQRPRPFIEVLVVMFGGFSLLTLRDLSL